MQLNQAVSMRVLELLKEHSMTQYQLFVKSGVPKSPLSNMISCSYDSIKLRIIHEICQGFEITIPEFLTPLSLMKSIWIHNNTIPVLPYAKPGFPLVPSS